MLWVVWLLLMPPTARPNISPAPSFSFHPPACNKWLFLCRVSWRMTLSGQCRVSDSIRRVLSDLIGREQRSAEGSSLLPFILIGSSFWWLGKAQPEMCDVRRADVAICVQFLFVSIVLPPFNPSFAFPLCSELPLYFVVPLFSAHSWWTSSHSFLHWKAPRHLAWISSRNPPHGYSPCQRWTSMCCLKSRENRKI